MIFGSHALHKCAIEILTQTPCTVVKLNSEVVKLNNERKVQSTDSFLFNPNEFIRLSCIVAET